MTRGQAAAPVVERLNRRLDAAVGPHIRFRRRLQGSWRVFSVAGFGVAVLVWCGAGLRGGVPLAALLIVPVVPAVLFSLRRRRVLRSARPFRLVLHREVAAWAVVAVPLLAVVGGLTRPVADAATTAFLAGLAVGRLGCFRSGCCTGRAAAVGPVYRWLPGGHRRLPVPLLESAACALLAAAALAAGTSPGWPAALGLGGYLTTRFGLDLLREERARTGRTTEAQWVALGLAVTLSGGLVIACR